MIKTRRSKMGKRLIAAMKEVVDHVEGRTALPMRYVEVPEAGRNRASYASRKGSEIVK
jgi:hypothetical protein